MVPSQTRTLEALARLDSAPNRQKNTPDNHAQSAVCTVRGSV